MHVPRPTQAPYLHAHTMYHYTLVHKDTERTVAVWNLLNTSIYYINMHSPCKMHSCTHTCTVTHARTQASSHASTHTHAHTHTHTYTCKHKHTNTHSTKAIQYTDGGSLPVEVAPSSLGCALVGTGPMGGLGLLGVSETVQYMRGCII